MNQALLSLVLAGLVIGGCAGTTTYKDFKASDVQAGQGVAIGRVRVRYNDAFYTKHCSICFASTSRTGALSSSCEKLPAEGIVFTPLPAGTGRLGRIDCGSVSHAIANASFVVPLGVVYFGDVVIEWQNVEDGPGERALALALMGPAAYVGYQFTKTQGTIVWSLDDDDNPEGVIRAYRDQVNDPNVVIYTSLAK